MDFAKRIVAPQNSQPTVSLKPLTGVKKPVFVAPKTDDVCVGYEKDTNKLVTLKDLFETAKVKTESSGVLFTPLITK